MPSLTPSRTEVPEVDVLSGHGEAIEAARRVAESLRAGAAQRDESKTLPHEQLGTIRASGLLAVPVPAEFGGVGGSHVTVAEVFRILAAADPAVTQIIQPHFAFVDAISRYGSLEQKNFFFAEVVAGSRLGNALSERGTKHPGDYKTTLTRDAAGDWRLNGRKYYSTGALEADWVAVLALTAEGEVRFAYVPGDVTGFVVDQDWTAFGQRATLSGTTLIEDVLIEDRQIFDVRLGDGQRAQTFGAYPQLQHAAIDIGIARGALEDGIAFTREKARPWPEAGVDRATEDQHIQLHFGRLVTLVNAAEALLKDAARRMDLAKADDTELNVTEARLGVAQAKAFGGEVALEVTTALFDGSGASAVDGRHHLDRHWRNARVHTLHDPNRWKYINVGNWVLNDIPPAASNHVI